MAKKSAIVLSIGCPICRRQNTTFTEVAFIDDYTVQVSFSCCGKELVSAELPVLSLFPNNQKDRRH